MSDLCAKLHRIIREGKRFDFCTGYQAIPLNGVYIMFEKGELAHDNDRIVRIGTHTGDKQLQSRIWPHFENENKNRSIFRKNIGRCLLNKEHSSYLETWELDSTSRKDKEKNLPLIDKVFEADIEKQISAYAQANLSFCVLEIPYKEERLYFERRLIGTVSGCRECSASPGWLGNSSPKPQIRYSGLWQVQGLNSPPLSQEELAVVSDKLICQDSL